MNNKLFDDLHTELLDGQHNGEFPKDEKLMCYMKCVLTQTKAVSEISQFPSFF